MLQLSSITFLFPTVLPSSVLLYALLIVLASYRVTRFILEDRLPARQVLRLQNAAEARWERAQLRRNRPLHPADRPSDEYQSSLAYLLSCPWCLGFWVAAAVTAIVGGPWACDFSWQEILLLVPAASATTGLLSYIEHTLDAQHDLARARLHQMKEAPNGQD